MLTKVRFFDPMKKTLLEEVKLTLIISTSRNTSLLSIYMEIPYFHIHYYIYMLIFLIAKYNLSKYNIQWR